MKTSLICSYEAVGPISCYLRDSERDPISAKCKLNETVSIEVMCAESQL